VVVDPVGGIVVEGGGVDGGLVLVVGGGVDVGCPVVDGVAVVVPPVVVSSVVDGRVVVIPLQIKLFQYIFVPETFKYANMIEN